MDWVEAMDRGQPGCHLPSFVPAPPNKFDLKTQIYLVYLWDVDSNITWRCSPVPAKIFVTRAGTSTNDDRDDKRWVTSLSLFPSIQHFISYKRNVKWWCDALLIQNLLVYKTKLTSNPEKIWASFMTDLSNNPDEGAYFILYADTFLERKLILDRNVPLNQCKGSCNLDLNATLGYTEQEIHRVSVFLSRSSHSWDTSGHAAFLPLPVHQSSPLSAHKASNAADDNDTVGLLTHAALPTAAPWA